MRSSPGSADDPRPALLAMDAAETAALCRRVGAAPVHGRTLRRALLAGWDPDAGVPMPAARGRRSPRDFLARMAEGVRWISTAVTHRGAAEDGAGKHLLRLDDGAVIEAVRLPGGRRPSACVTTQVGCAMACRFCASGLDGVRRNLGAHEILEQVALLRRSGPVRRLVFMGAGEPTQNLSAVETALPVLRDEAGIGPRHVLLSTVGPARAIARVTEMAARGLPLTLALSLHALDPALRAELVPTQAGVDPADLLAAADRHVQATGRPYQVEWVLLGGVNDAPADARALARALAGRRAHVSLIPWNRVDGLPFAPPPAARAEAFLGALHDGGVSARLRRTVGGAADAACGQLRARAAEDAGAGVARVS